MSEGWEMCKGWNGSYDVMDRIEDINFNMEYEGLHKQFWACRIMHSLEEPIIVTDDEFDKCRDKIIDKLKEMYFEYRKGLDQLNKNIDILQEIKKKATQETKEKQPFVKKVKEK